MQASSKFNLIVVLESLPANDMKTGKRVYDDQLMHINSKYAYLNSELIQVESADEFVNALRGLTLRVEEQDVIPLLHIECHGSKSGLTMADGSALPWARLKNELIALNRATKLNLTVVVGACNGGHLIGTASHMDGAPFFGIIGVDGEVTNGDLEQRFKNFYPTFFQTGDANAAIDSLNHGISDQNKRFMFLGARLFFAEGFRKYYLNYCRGKKKSKRTEMLVSRVLQDQKVANLGIKFAREQVKKHLSDPKEHFEFFRNRFFFCDHIPEILERLPLDYDEVIQGKYA